MNRPNCDYCGQEMDLKKRLQDGINMKGQKYRRRRYYCILCDIYHTKYADGSGDNQQVIEAVAEARKL